MADKTVGVPGRALYAIPESMVLLSLSRTQIYELIRSDRLLTVTQGRRRLVPAEAISAYVALLLSEAGSGRDRVAQPGGGRLVVERVEAALDRPGFGGFHGDGQTPGRHGVRPDQDGGESQAA
jgi:hypothetical protein